MSDVLKMVEEALEVLEVGRIGERPDGKHICLSRECFAGLAAGCTIEDFGHVDTCPWAKRDAALTALRGLAWKPLEEMEETGVQVVCGKWVKWGGKWQWITCDGWVNKKAAQMSRYTHFCRPILPAPPTREVG